MVLVRCKTDGLYFTNRGGRRSWSRRGNHDNWVSDIQLCKPFVNEGGARNAMHSHVPYVNCACPRGRSRAGWIKTCEHEKARQAEIRRRFDEQYDIVPVKLALEIA